MTLTEVTRLLKAFTDTEHEPEYRATRFGPVRTGFGTGECLCGRAISVNKAKCAKCASGDSGVSIHPDILRDLPLLAPGVHGYTVEHDGAMYIPVILADAPGSGDTGRYLDSLPRDRTIRVPTVTNDVLEGMLRRRGFTAVTDLALNGESVTVWEKKAVPVAIQRLMDEVRLIEEDDSPTPLSYDRGHNRHNRGPGGPGYDRAHNRHNR